MNVRLRSTFLFPDPVYATKQRFKERVNEPKVTFLWQLASDTIMKLNESQEDDEVLLQPPVICKVF